MYFNMHFPNEFQGYALRNRAGIIHLSLHRSNWEGVRASADCMVCSKSTVGKVKLEFDIQTPFKPSNSKIYNIFPTTHPELEGILENNTSN